MCPISGVLLDIFLEIIFEAVVIKVCRVYIPLCNMSSKMNVSPVEFNYKHNLILNTVLDSEIIIKTCYFSASC